MTRSTPTDQAEQTNADELRSSAEERVERIATYWANACIAAWRTVFPGREDDR